MLGKPKYTYKDKVEFKWPRSINLIGYIQVVDSFGTFEQQEEPSYDIYVDANNTLYKHVKESEVIRKIENNDFEIITVSSKEQFEKPA